MQDVKIIVSNHGNLAQCPDSERHCPTCGQYHSLLDHVERMDMKMRQMEQTVGCAFKGNLVHLTLCCDIRAYRVYHKKKDTFINKS